MVNVARQYPEYRVKEVCQREFNSFLEDEHGRPKDPRHHFEMGDPILHFPGSGFHRRIELIRQHLPKVIK
jgi:hypothetical protein